MRLYLDVSLWKGFFMDTFPCTSGRIQGLQGRGTRVDLLSVHGALSERACAAYLSPSLAHSFSPVCSFQLKVIVAARCRRRQARTSGQQGVKGWPAGKGANNFSRLNRYPIHLHCPGTSSHRLHLSWFPLQIRN